MRMWKPSSVVEAVENVHYAEEHMNLNGGMRLAFLHRPGFMGKAPRTFPNGWASRPPPYGNRVAPRIVAVGISMAASATSRSSPMMQVGPRPSQGTTSREGVPGEGTHFRDSHRTIHNFNPVLPVRNVEDPITSVTSQSYNQDLCVEKERPQWEEKVAATIFTQQLIIARPNINPKYEGYSLEIDGLLRYRGRMYIPENGDI